jgi:beta-galactosidase
VAAASARAAAAARAASAFDRLPAGALPSARPCERSPDLDQDAMRRRDFLKTTAAGGAALALFHALPGWRVLGPGELPGARHDFNGGWRFLRGDAGGAHLPGHDHGAWEGAILPHTARIEALVTGLPGTESWQWQGTAWYRKVFRPGPELAGRKVYLKFDGAMNVSDVWLNGEHLGQHRGGYLPFGYDLTDRLVVGRENLVAVRLDNRDDPITGPKPLPILDFNPYHGIYREAHLIVKDRLHITDPILADRPASGGVFVRFEDVSGARATLRVRVHARNDHGGSREITVRLGLLDAAGRRVAHGVSDPQDLPAGGEVDVEVRLEVSRPALWSPLHPHLHTLHTELLSGGVPVDEEVTRIGIRHIDFSVDGFRINGQPLFLRGTNRHQEYPYVGYAVPAASQYRDARRIKEAGFDFVRLSHYPHDPAFMDACDELGLVTMNCIPGWQFFNDDPRFAEVQYDNVRRMIRRDRNRPGVVLWEVSLNETRMPAEFIARTEAIAREEFPGDQCFTCGWQRGYDVFIQARQHGGCTRVTDVPCMVSEYGDWEYYAQNAGLEQDAWQDLAPDDANSRQLRWHGERALLQQATNFQEAHNDNRKTIAFADGLWVMYDYNRGYAPDIESSGCQDIFRLPKFSSFFFRSQRDPDERYDQAATGPMVFIASHWTPASATDVRVFSNCDEVALLLNGHLLERRRPDRDRLSTHLAHPPFTFPLGRFTPGTLEAIGFLDGREAARHAVRTPGPPHRLALGLALDGREFATLGKDVTFLHAALLDQHGTVAHEAWENVSFGATGDVALVGTNPFSTDAGIASILLQAEAAGARGAVYALAIVPGPDGFRVLANAEAVGASAGAFDLRYTTDGRAPDRQADRYAGPISGAARVRAALFIHGDAIVTADSAADRFRVPGSVAPNR